MQSYHEQSTICKNTLEGVLIYKYKIISKTHYSELLRFYAKIKYWNFNEI